MIFQTTLTEMKDSINKIINVIIEDGSFNHNDKAIEISNKYNYD